MTREIVSTSKQDWATPQWLFDVLHEELKFDVDLMAAWYNAKLPTFVGPGSSLREDLFSLDLGCLNGFANPPYKIIEKCLSYACRQALAGARSTWLVPANTDTQWFHEHAHRGQIDFFKGRISFEDVTPPEIEAERLWTLVERKGEKGIVKDILKDVRKIADLFKELGDEWLLGLSKSDRLYEALQSVDAHCPDWRSKAPAKNRKKPGPGFPSMLVHFEPGLPTPGAYRRRSAKTGRLL